VRLLDESGSFVLPGTFEPMRAGIGLTYAQASSTFLVMAVGAVAGTVAPLAADRHSRRAICAAGALAYALSLVVLGTAGSFALVAAGAFLLGAASTAMVDVTEMALAEVAGDDLERHLTTQNVLGSIGDLLGPAIVVAALGTGLSWRVVFFATAVLVAAYGVWLATLPFPPPAPADDGEDGSGRSALRSVVTDPLVWLAAIATTLLGPLDEPLVAFAIAHLEEARGLSEAGATVVVTFTVVGDFVGYATLRRWPSALAVDAALLAAATTALVLAPAPVAAVLASLLVGVFLIRVWLDLQARTLRLRPGRTGAVLAMVNVVDTVGWALPLGAGAVADRLDVTAGLAVYAVVAWALAGAAILLVRATRRRATAGRATAGRGPTLRS
jgi:MFS family permease